MLTRRTFAILFYTIVTWIVTGLAASASYATEIYISVDEQGNRVFSDQPSKESRKHKLKELSIIPAIKIPSKTVTKNKAEDESVYQTLTITSPSAETYFTRDKLGNINVSAQIVPKLKEGDEATLLINGKEVQSGNHLSWQLTNTDRGEHALQVVVRNKETKEERISSQTVTVYVRR